MTLYGPLTAEDFLRLLKRLADGRSDRPFFDGVLDAIIDAFEAERGFLLRVREDGGLNAVAARNFEAESVSRPLDCISHHALRLAMLSADGHHHTDRAHIDRRYRTQEVTASGRRPMSVLVYMIPGDGDEDAAVYLDHRFQEIEVSEHRRRLADHWLALLRLGLRLRDQRGELRRREREVEQARAAGAKSGPASPPEPAREPPPAPEPLEPVELHGMWTRSPAMVELLETVLRLGRSEIPVLITGETGTGKSALARAIHASSARSERPFVSVDCGALSESLLESELFGHLRGSFTGAEADHQGLIAQADGGTLFLDEIGDMSHDMQKKLLRFLENGKYRPVGGKEERQGDVRIVSSTRLELEGEVGSGRFRPDLFYRLCAVRLEIPPLRERREDVVGLAERFLAASAAEIGVEAPRLDERARRWLIRHPWMGNVRELQNLMRQQTALGVDVIDAGTLGRAVCRTTGPLHDDDRRYDMATIVEAAERHAIRQALGTSGGNKSKAARLLGITRKSLYRRLVKYDFLEGNEHEERVWEARG